MRMRTENIKSDSNSTHYHPNRTTWGLLLTSIPLSLSAISSFGDENSTLWSQVIHLVCFSYDKLLVATVWGLILFLLLIISIGKEATHIISREECHENW